MTLDELQKSLSLQITDHRGEIATARDSGAYDYLVVNDILETTVEEVCEIIRKEKALT